KTGPERQARFVVETHPSIPSLQKHRLDLRAPGHRADIAPAAFAARPKKRAKPRYHHHDDDSRSPQGRNCLRFSQKWSTAAFFEQERNFATAEIDRLQFNYLQKIRHHSVSTTPVDKNAVLRRVRELADSRATPWFVDGTPLASRVQPVAH